MTRNEGRDRLHIGVAGIIHETNSFAPGKTMVDDFQEEWVTGKEQFYHRYEGTKTSMSGAIDGAANENVKLSPGLYTYATPSGMISQEAVEELVEAVVQSVDEEIDGLLVILHGAMVSELYMDVEGEILSRLRKRFSSNFPLAITLDLHANISRLMVEHADILVGYDTYPHIDAYDRAVEAFSLLVRTVRAEVSPVTCYKHSRMLIAPQTMITNEGVMKELMERAFAMEKEDKVLNVTVAGGFPYSDVPDAGMSFVVTTDGDVPMAKRLANELSQRAWKRREDFKVQEVTVEGAIRQSLNDDQGPDIFIEGSDNVGGGAPADATHTLKHLVDLPHKSLMVVRDTEAVQSARQIGVGGMLKFSVGGKSDTLHGEPVSINGNIRLLFDGFYRHVGSYMTGKWADMGDTAVVEAGRLTLILTEKRSAPWDIGHVLSIGIDPEEFKIIVVKSAVAWKTAFGAFAKKEIYLDTPGCCSSNLNHFNYEKLKRPIYPFDPFE